MIVVRYGTLVALVLWLAAMLGSRFGDLSRVFPSLTLICGALVVVGLLTMKFMGPPPPAFLPRLGLALLMVAVAGASAWFGAARTAPWPLVVNLILGFLLLYWYARE
jgi:hypothetical protein